MENEVTNKLAETAQSAQQKKSFKGTITTKTLVSESDFIESSIVSESDFIESRSEIMDDIFGITFEVKENMFDTPIDLEENIVQEKKDPTKLEIIKTTSLMLAFGINPGDVFDIIKICKNNDGVAYKYIVYVQQTKSTVGFPAFQVRVF